MDQSLKPPDSAYGGIGSSLQEYEKVEIEDVSADDALSNSKNTMKLSTVNNILLHDSSSKREANRVKKVVKRKKVKVTKNKGPKPDWDNNNIVDAAAKTEKTDSNWQSNRSKAMRVDLSNQNSVLSRKSPGLEKKKSQENNSRRPKNLLDLPEAKKFTGQPLVSSANDHLSLNEPRTFSQAGLSMQEIEEAVEMVSPGLKSENINLGSQQAMYKRNDNSRLSNTNQAGF